MKVWILLFPFLFYLSCSSAEKQLDKKDPVVVVNVNPCGCSAVEYKRIAQKKIIYQGLKDYSKQNSMILDPELEREIASQPQRYLYDFYMDMGDSKKDSVVKVNSDTSKSVEVIADTPKVTTNDAPKDIQEDPWNDINPSNKPMDFDGFDEDLDREKRGKNTTASKQEAIVEKPITASGKLNTQEVDNFLKDKEAGSHKGYKVYSSKHSSGSKGLEAIKGFQSDRLDHKKRLDDVREQKTNYKKESYDNYKKDWEKKRP